LLVVLFIIMAITVLSLGFLSRSDVELACGQNMILRTQMDYLAESGLQHARGLILNPQDVGLEYWTGATSQQLSDGSNDYYDVAVIRDDSDPTNHCNYIIDCNAYRLKSGEEIGRSRLSTELRLDPVIAYWIGASTTVSSVVTINGDVYCAGNLTSMSNNIRGDVFAAGTIGGLSPRGKKNQLVAQAPVDWPGLSTNDFSSTYYYDGAGPYAVQILDPNYDSSFPGPGANNPACVYYRDGNLELKGNINITGMLVVKDDLKLKSNCNLTITALKNFPALLAGRDIKIENFNQSITVTGLVQVNNHIDMLNKVGSSINATGALCINGDGIVNTTGCTVRITAFPDKAALETWPTGATSEKWTPAAGAFFISINRK
jgi:hypothetical protein